MDRSQEKVLTSQAKLHALDQSANIHQKVRENQAGTNVNRTAQRKVTGDSLIENLPFIEGRNGGDGLNTRKPEPIISPLQAQYFHTVSNAGVLPPYLPTQAMDHRALSNFLYRYNPQMAVFPQGYPANYAQRLPNGEEAREREPTANLQSSERSSDASGESKEPVRTESVIKTVAERTDSSRKPEAPDKRHAGEEYSRPYVERNGDLEPPKHGAPTRGPRDKPEVTSNGDAQQHRSSTERTLSDFRPYQTPSANGKAPGAYAKDYSVQKSDYVRPPTSSQPGMFAGMPKLTPIAPRGHPSMPFSSSSSAPDGSSRSATVGPSVRPSSGVYHTPRDYPLTTEGLISAHRSDTRSEELSDSHKINYLARNPAYDNFPAYWERSDYAVRYPGHSAYQGYAYGRTMHSKQRPDDKENVKELEDTRNRPSDSIKDSSISPDRTHFSKEHGKGLEPNGTHNRDQVSSHTYNPAVTSHSDQPPKNQVTLSKNEKPVLPENVRYKVNDDKKNALKSDKVTVYPKQGQAYVVSVRETPHSYFANGRYADSPEDRTQSVGGFESTVSKKDDSQRSSGRAIKEKSTSEIRDKFVDGGQSSEYSRRRIDATTHDRTGMSSFDDSKKPNDRNNNSSFSSYPRYQSPNDRPRPPNRISLGQDKVFVPPNVTLEMFEKREQEMERAAASCRTTDSTRSSDLGSSTRVAKVPVKKDGEVDTKYHSPEQPNTRPGTNKPETTHPKSDSSSKSSDDEELKIIEERVAPAQVPQTRNGRPEEKRTLSPSRLSRITSPNVPNVSTANNSSYFTPFGSNFNARRTPNDNEMAARENAERNMQAAYLYGGNIPFQPNVQFMGHGGRGEMPVMLPLEMLYGSMYKSHMVDPAQGGTVMQDPLTGSLVVVPEALLNQSMFNPLVAEQLMLDPQFARFWGMPQASMEDPRWQQFHQQQTKHFYEQMEKYKHDMMMAQQQGWWQGYPFYQKQFEALKKDDESNSRTDQRPKSRDDPSLNKQRTEKPEESSNKDKQAAQVSERPAAALPSDPRREDPDNKPDTSSQRPSSKPEPSETHITGPTVNEKPDSVPAREPVKPTVNEHSEERSKTKETIQQEEQARQFQQYMLRDPVFDQTKFSFPRMQASLPKPLYSPNDAQRDRPRDFRDASHNPCHFPEVTRSEVSPQVVSAAATLANMDLGTRFPFNQQPYLGSEQIDRRSTAKENVKTEKATSPRASERPFLDNKMELSTVPPPKRTSNEIPITSQVKKETTSRNSHDGFHVPSLIQKSPKSSSQGNRRNSSEDQGQTSNMESSRLLVARAEKLSQDEELEVIRIDTPYLKTEQFKQERQMVDDKTQDTNLLMSLSKDIHGTAESPSSKSEIFWTECSDVEEDFEVQTICDSVRPHNVEFDGHNKENSIMLSLQTTKTEEEKKIIREKIEKLRIIAKRRTREERFTALTRQKELKSPSSIVNSVTASLNEVLAMNVMEKDIRLKLAELQKKYREKHRELARLQPKCKHGNDDNNGGKSTPIKRGPGRPRKRKYFGASMKSGKTTPTLPTGDSIDDATCDPVENTFKSGGSSPSSCPQSPGLKSVTSEDIPVFKDSVEPVKTKKKKKSSTNKKKDTLSPLLPETVSPTIAEPKPRVKSSKQLSSSSSKSRSSSSGVPMTTTTSANSSNMATLISAISPLMLEDNCPAQPGNIESNPPAPQTVKPKPKKAKKIKKDKRSEESVEPSEPLSSDLTSPAPESLTLPSKANKVKSTKKSKKKSKTPATPKGKTAFVFPEPVSNTEQQKSSSKKKETAKQNDREKKAADRDEDSSENDEVFTCLTGGALDLLANFASSASFEEDKQLKRESPFDKTSLKGMKRGRPKNTNSPGPESDPPNPPKKKRKKKKPMAPGSKSPRKGNSTPEEKENEVVPQPESAAQTPLASLHTLPVAPPAAPPIAPAVAPIAPSVAPTVALPVVSTVTSPTSVENVEPTQQPTQQPKPEPVEKSIDKAEKGEFREAFSEEDEMIFTSKEPEREVTPPPETIKEKRRKSRTSLHKEVDDSKPAFALFNDWQPRRSERIFINSSVTPQSSADLSPLSSPTSKTNEFGWTKKAKKVSKGKRPTKSEEVSDAEAAEEETPAPITKPVVKTKKKKSPGKGKKRRSSSVTDPDFVLRTPKRKAAKRDRSYEEADEDEDEDMGEEVDDIQEDDVEDKDIYHEDAQGQPTQEPNDISDREDTTKQEEQSSKQESHDIMTKEIDDNVVNSTKDTETIGQSVVNDKKENHIEETSLEALKPSSGTEIQSKVTASVVRKNEVLEDASESLDIDEKDNLKKEVASYVESTHDQITDSTLNTNEPTSKATAAESTSMEETTIERADDDIPPEPVISFTKEELKDNTKMLLPVGRVFYRGRITFYQEPDLYGIVLPGERGRRPHLRSTEQLLSHAVKDIIPPAVKYLPIGTRVCAHWSPQYRCFYPGSVIETPPDEKSELGKLWVEFDDGDSGIFPLSDLRKINTDCPVQVDDVESDVVLPERRAHFPSSRGTSPSNRRSKEQETSLKNKDDDTSGWDSTDDGPIRRTRGRGKRRAKQRDRRLSEEATDSDAPRGNQDSEDEDNTDHVERSSSRNKLASNAKGDTDSNLRSSRQKRSKRRSRLSLEEQEPEETDVTTEAGEVTKRYHKDDKRKESKSKKKNQEEDTDDEETPQEPGTIRHRARSSRLSDLDLRKRSLTLNLNNSPRSGIIGSESPAQDSTSQDEDSGSCSDVFDDSPQTENKLFQPRLGKRRRSVLERLKQKSAGELWSWSGKNHQNKRKGKRRKVFYKTIVRGDEAISVGDCAVFTSNPSKSNNLPYVGKIESMWEGFGGNMVVRVKWYYHPEETKAGRKPSDTKHSLYRSTHVDENDVQTISHKCEVVTPEEYKKRTLDTIGTRSTTTDRSDRLFTCVGTYDPNTEKIDQKSE